MRILAAPLQMLQVGRATICTHTEPTNIETETTLETCSVGVVDCRPRDSQLRFWPTFTGSASERKALHGSQRLHMLQGTTHAAYNVWGHLPIQCPAGRLPDFLISANVNIAPTPYIHNKHPPRSNDYLVFVPHRYHMLSNIRGTKQVQKTI